MAYHLDEGNLERQRLLARLLNPFTEPHLARLAPKPSGRWLDVGCGIGETTKMLARHMSAGSECVGLDGDPVLLEVARSQPWGAARVAFEQGDATSLSFEDRSFDFVFSRYLLMHLPDPVLAIREMLRVTKPGGMVFAQEPDFAFQCCYPRSPAYERIPELFGAVFPDAEIGRKLVHLFRQAGSRAPMALCDIGIEYDGTDVTRIYRMSLEALESALLGPGKLSRSDFDGLMDELRRVEQDPTIVVLANPIVAVWAGV